MPIKKEDKKLTNAIAIIALALIVNGAIKQQKQIMLQLRNK